MPFSSNYQIKLIGTGLEAGTWGTSTNNNLERIEQSLGQSVAINVESPPGTSTGASVGNSWVMEWITSDTANVGVAGSEGRARYVEFISDGAVTNEVTVQVRGSTSGILPNRIYFVRNSINTGSTTAKLTLNAGSGATYTVESGACALVVINGTSIVGGLTSGTALNAISNLQIDNLQFSAAAADIKLPNNVAAALEIKSTSVNSEFLRFDTANNHLEIAPGSAVNNIELLATDIVTSTQPTAVTIDPADTNALLVKTASKSLVNLNTSTDALTLSSGTVFLDNATGVDISVPDNVVDALDVFTGGVNFIRLDTVNGSNTGTLELLPSKCDMTVGTGNTLQMSAGSTLDVDGTATFVSATLTTADINGGTIDGADINGGTIDSTSIGSGVVSTVRGSSYSVPQANYNVTNGGFVFEDGFGRAGFTKETLATPVKLRQTGSGQRGFITSSEMVSATPTNNTGYFRGEHVFLTDVQSVSVVLTHNLSSTPSRVEWSLVANAVSGTENYDVGDMVSLTSSWNTDDANGAMVTTWKNATEIGFNSNRYGARGIVVVDKTNPSAGGTNPSRVILSNWKLVVEAWE
tara:strand:- start:7718 stop:9457 length:1740 start_codon:yes stop_codon:yes gene_type:complete